MKWTNLILIFSIVVSAFVITVKDVIGCCGGPMEGTSGITLRVEDINTLDDAGKVESALKSYSGVMDAHVYIEKKEAAVTLSSNSVPEEALIQCVEKAGFHAFLPTNLNLQICTINENSSPEGLGNSLSEIPGIMIRDVDFEHKQISVDIYIPWIKTAKRLIDVIEDNGYLLCLSKETLEFKLGNVSTVDAFDARAYVQLLFGVISADLNLDENLLTVVIYKELVTIDDVIRTMKERGFTDDVRLISMK